MNRRRKKELDEKWKKIATEAVTDDKFKRKLINDPVGVMSEFEIILPEGVDAKKVTGNVLRLVPSAELTEEIKEETKWWQLRLDMIREFGQEDGKASAEVVAPETEDGI